MYILLLLLFVFVNVNCLYIHENHQSWPNNPQVENIVARQLRGTLSNYELSGSQMPRQQTVVVVPNSGQIPASQSASYGYAANTINRTPTTVIISPPAEYPRY